MQEMLMDAAQVAETLKVGKKKIYKMIQANQLPALHIGGSIRVPREALCDWIRLQTTVATVRQEGGQQ
jgi:excisionase family DNA binding protein